MHLNLAQRAVLTLMLVVDGLFCLYPPFAVHEHHWLFWHDRFRGFFPYPIDIWRLALEIFVVTLIGAAACVLASALSDDRVRSGFAWWRQKWTARHVLLLVVILILAFGSLSMWLSVWTTDQLQRQREREQQRQIIERLWQHR